MVALNRVSYASRTIAKTLTSLIIHLMLVTRLSQVRQCRLEGVIRTNDIDVHHRFERIGRKLLNRSQEVTRRARTTRLASLVN